MIDSPLTTIKRNGYPCTSRDFWWLVDEVELLQKHLDALRKISR